MTTMTGKIFELNAPYSNPYQGDKMRLLFVCSVGLLRSPTAAHVASAHGYNTRSCGSSTEYALIPLSANLVMWAHRIIFINIENYKEALRTFENTGYDEDIKIKATIWDIKDNYRTFDPKLEQIITDILNSEDFQNA